MNSISSAFLENVTPRREGDKAEDLSGACAVAGETVNAVEELHEVLSKSMDVYVSASKQDRGGMVNTELCLWCFSFVYLFAGSSLAKPNFMNNSLASELSQRILLPPHYDPLVLEFLVRTHW